MKSRLVGVLGAVAIAAIASSAAGQVAASAEPVVSGVPRASDGNALEPVGPHDLLGGVVPTRWEGGTPFGEEDSALVRVREAPEGGYPNMATGPAQGRVQHIGGNGGDDGQRYVDQRIDCTTGAYSNNNSNNNPYLTFDDFVADGRQLGGVEFYGGVYGGSYSLNAIDRIGIEIWTITGGGECGWAYSSFVYAESFTLNQLSPAFVCDTSGVYDSYKFSAHFGGCVSLNAGQNYMITIYASLKDPDAGDLFVWSYTDQPHYNASSSWNRTDQHYYRCGPDVAFRTVTCGSDCQANDCNTTCYFSNYISNANPYIALDDFTARASGDLRQLQFTGGVYDLNTGTGALLGNIAGFYIEIYDAVATSDFPCGNYVGTFYGAYTVAMADARPNLDCIDIFGIPHYQFTVSIPAGTYPLTAGHQYMLGVYGIPQDPNSSQIFCWGGSSAIYGFTSWSYNVTNGQQEVCHEVDQAFCINGPRPCLGDFNKDGKRDTRDVLDFLNAWNARLPSSDCNGDGVINTQDVLCFLNRWNVAC